MLSLSSVAFVLLCIHVSSLGLTWILMYGTILDPIRSWLTKWTFFHDLLRCGQCTGFWAGLFHLIVFMLLCINYSAMWSNTLEQMLLCFAILTVPLQTSAVCYAFDHLIIGVAKGVGDMIFYKNKQLKQQDDQLNVYHQDGSSNTTTSNVSSSACQTTASTTTTTA